MKRFLVKSLGTIWCLVEIFWINVCTSIAISLLNSKIFCQVNISILKKNEALQEVENKGSSEKFYVTEVVFNEIQGLFSLFFL